eukprot:TRINITY_DN30834_c0_g1_i1.p1 TRINITY_DN30834_c0_g1~~TRINITY_DN30834_c0_g1_i1.p1  ORF type:complete len:479 (+),score=71.15 TRINITY_DN30834_c0_g1_i1:95-1438(+)
MPTPGRRQWEESVPEVSKERRVRRYCAVSSKNLAGQQVEDLTVRRVRQQAVPPDTARGDGRDCVLPTYGTAPHVQKFVDVDGERAEIKGSADRAPWGAQGRQRATQLAGSTAVHKSLCKSGFGPDLWRRGGRLGRRPQRAEAPASAAPFVPEIAPAAVPMPPSMSGLADSHNAPVVAAEPSAASANKPRIEVRPLRLPDDETPRSPASRHATPRRGGTRLPGSAAATPRGTQPRPQWLWEWRWGGEQGGSPLGNASPEEWVCDGVGGLGDEKMRRRGRRAVTPPPASSHRRQRESEPGSPGATRRRHKPADTPDLLAHPHPRRMVRPAEPPSMQPDRFRVWEPSMSLWTASVDNPAVSVLGNNPAASALGHNLSPRSLAPSQRPPFERVSCGSPEPALPPPTPRGGASSAPRSATPSVARRRATSSVPRGGSRRGLDIVSWQPAALG